MLQATDTRLPPSAALAEILDRQQGVLRDQLARTLSPELDRLGPQAPAVLDVLAAFTGWRYWSLLRSGFGYSAAQAERSIVFTVVQVLHDRGAASEAFGLPSRASAALRPGRLVE